MEFIGQLKKLDDNDNTANYDAQSIFVLTIFRKHKKTRLKFSQGSVTVLKKMANYQEVRIKLTNTQLNKLKSAAKNKTGTILKLIKKNFENEEFPH